jgi:superfamily I DNA/RNA helicase
LTACPLGDIHTDMTNETKKWSPQQTSIFNWFKGGRGNLVVRARAGTGKTTTIIEAITFAPEEKILLAAFNKKIAEELKTKLKNPKAEAKTLHGVGFAFVGRNWQGVRVDTDRGERLARAALPSNAPDSVVTLVKKLSALGKNACPSPDRDTMVDLAYRFDLDPEEELEEAGWTAERIAEASIVAMNKALVKDGTIDFDDMIFVPIRNGWVRPKYNMVVIDEAQDMNAAQLILAMKVCKAGGRICVVGDDRQAIYGFRGADSNSIDRLKGDLVAAELGLTITYRCPKAVVAVAAELVPDYTAAPTAPEGIVRGASYEEMVEKAEAGDFVLSRKNAPLTKVCLKFIRMGRRAMIEGRDIGTGLIALMKKVKGKSVNDFLTRLEKWETKQVAKLQAAGKSGAEKKIEFVTDQAETLRALADAAKSLPDIEKRIKDMFQETGGGKHDYVVCSSVHKSKGLERNRVWGLVETLYPGGRKDAIEEQNIEYVMVTRAKNEFVSVTGVE